MMVNPSASNNFLSFPFHQKQGFAVNRGCRLSPRPLHPDLNYCEKQSLPMSPIVDTRKKRKVSHSKSVRFNNSIQIHEASYPGIEEARCRWLQRHEYASIREHVRVTLLAIRNAHESNQKLAEDENMCIRGLEKQIMIWVYKVDQNRWRKIPTRIVGRQKRQRRVGIENQEMLRSFSMILSEESRQRAILRAESDSFEAV